MFKNFLFPVVLMLGLLSHAQAQSKYYHIRSFRNEDLTQKSTSYQYYVWDAKKVSITGIGNAATATSPEEYTLATRNYTIEKKESNTIWAKRVSSEKKTVETDNSMFIFLRTKTISYAPDFLQISVYESKNKEELIKQIAEANSDYYEETLITETFINQVKNKPVLPADISKTNFIKLLEIIKTKLQKAQESKEKVNENALMLTALSEAGYNSMISKRSFKDALDKFKADEEVKKLIEEVEQFFKKK